MSTARITKARITAMPATMFSPMPKVIVEFDDKPGQEEELFEYYPDEISFRPEEFIGLTKEEARALKGKKDRQYLQSN